MAGQNPPRAWQRMLSGRRLDLLNPSPIDIEIEDIAHGLARVARWNGQTLGQHAFSVAQHSLLVTDIAAHLNPTFSNMELRAALLHDAPEYVVGDLISPFKSALGIDYKAFEIKLLEAIHQRFEISALSENITAAIKNADRVAAYYEATRLAGFEVSEAEIYFAHHSIPNDLSAKLDTLTPWPSHQAQSLFIERFRTLAAA
ncbi:MAG: hydrolase [Hyphomicrobium sp.]|nr:MAG: hydrolase [Hyphomicrobium sp.]PPD01934.1 MAG: hydrolase [Hyphomicrobium sp.]